jgi:acyl carrier protein
MRLTRDVMIRRLIDEFELEPAEAEIDGLLSGGLLDSFSMLDLVTWVERESGVKFRPTDFNLHNLDSVDRILRYLDARAVAG